MFRQFLEKGIAIAGVDVGESYGNPAGRKVLTALWEKLRKDYGLAERACLMPQSRGGLMLYNWAAENPQRVACIAGIYPVCDLRSYPGLDKTCGAYGMDEPALAAHLSEHNPIDRLKPLADAGLCRIQFYAAGLVMCPAFTWVNRSFVRHETGSH